MRSYLEEVDFETIKQRFDAFWDREILDRPLIYITAPKEKQKKRDFPIPKSMEERWTNIEYILNKIEFELENTLFLGDAIPFYMPNLGPDSFTAFLGGDLKFISEETSWAEPFLDDLFGYEPVLKEDNKWWKIMNDLLDAICEVAEGNFLVGIPDLHYGGDSLAAAIGTQRLIRYLFTEPEEVKRLLKRLTDLCIEVFEHYYRKISRVQKGSITWIPAYSRGRYFALQDDISGFVSPKMFEEFFVERQEVLSRYLDNSIFHLDGPMALNNLDRLLRIDTLDGIQWIPGAKFEPKPGPMSGLTEPMSKWVNICSKILNADKCLQIWCRPDEVEFLLSELKHEGLFLCTICSTEREARSVLKIVERFK